MREDQANQHRGLIKVAKGQKNSCSVHSAILREIVAEVKSQPTQGLEPASGTTSPLDLLSELPGLQITFAPQALRSRQGIGI